MGFQSVRKFVSVRHYAKIKNPLTISIVANGKLKNGDTTYGVSLRLDQSLIKKMGWNEETRLDVLIDDDNQVAMIRPDPTAYLISFPTKADDGSINGMSAWVKFSMIEPFEHLSKDTKQLPLTIIASEKDSIVFEMPKVKVEATAQQSELMEPQPEVKPSLNCNRVERPFSLSLE